MSSQEPCNALLCSLPEAMRSALIAQCEVVSLPVRTELFNPLKRPQYVHFLTSGIASSVTSMEEGEAVEVGITGYEGFAEKYHLLGPQTGSVRCFIQVAATAYRISLQRLQPQFLENTPLQAAVHRYIQQDAMGLAQLSACNRIHEVEPRLARWLLMVQDRVKSNEIVLTQEFLGEMLGTRRSTVNLAASSLQRSGYISYSRGRITIHDRGALQQVACECYSVISALFAGMYR